MRRRIVRHRNMHGHTMSSYNFLEYANRETIHCTLIFKKSQSRTHHISVTPRRMHESKEYV